MAKTPVFEFIVPGDVVFTDEQLALLSQLGLERDDFISVSPGTDAPVEVCRQHPPNYGALLGALMVGAIQPADGAMPSSVVASQLQLCVGAPPPRPSAPGRWLQLLKR
jgi:hypothetical protein